MRRPAGAATGYNPRPTYSRATVDSHPTPRTPQYARPERQATGQSRPFDARDARNLGPAEPRGGTRPDSNPDPDPRVNRPDHDHHHHRHPHASGPPPYYPYYGGYYAGWYCHPWYRYTHWTSSVVWFGFGVDPWGYGWIPPYRYGWNWVPGYFYWGWWHPGYWRPAAVVPVGYVYVPGWWEADTVYVEGYYRKQSRDEWRWVDGRYLEDGTYLRGNWMPTGPAPEGYTWVAGFWNGEEWLEGFWRPEYRSGYRWLDGYYDESGIFYAGYWEPVDDRPGYVWVPGWFDGNGWVNGEWIPEGQLDVEDPANWIPEKGTAEPEPVELPDEAPLALPVIPDEPEGAEEAPAEAPKAPAPSFKAPRAPVSE